MNKNFSSISNKQNKNPTDIIPTFVSCLFFERKKNHAVARFKFSWSDIKSDY